MSDRTNNHDEPPLAGREPAEAPPAGEDGKAPSSMLALWRVPCHSLTLFLLLLAGQSSAFDLFVAERLLLLISAMGQLTSEFLRVSSTQRQQETATNELRQEMVQLRGQVNEQGEGIIVLEEETVNMEEQGDQFRYLVHTLQEEIRELREENAQRNAEIDHLRGRIAKLAAADCKHHDQAHGHVDENLDPTPKTRRSSRKR